MTQYEDAEGKKRTSLSLIQRKRFVMRIMNRLITELIGDIEVLRRPRPAMASEGTETETAQAGAA
jgi:hypothetical protein